MKIRSENTGPHYRSMVDPLTADKRDRVIPAYGIRRKVVSLTAARTNEPLGLKGDVWYCDYNSTGVGLVQLNNSSEDPLPAIALGGLGNMPFDEIFLTNTAQPGLVLNLWYGYGADFISPTSAIATIGSITNPVTLAAWRGLNRLYSPGFMGRSNLGAVAAQDANVQLFNPGASGVNVYVDSVVLSNTHTAAGFAQLRHHNAALTTLVAQGINKTIGGAAALGAIRNVNSAASLGTVIGEYPLAVNANERVKFEEPIILPPGFGLHSEFQVVNAPHMATFEWREGV